LDPANEGDAFYQTALAIHRYFSGRFSIVAVLSAIHWQAGNVRAAVSALIRQLGPGIREELAFDFRTVEGSAEERCAYFA
jgi:hypothetical protein